MGRSSGHGLLAYRRLAPPWEAAAELFRFAGAWAPPPTDVFAGWAAWDGERLVGALMMGGIKELEWRKLDEAIPSFLTVAMMPFTYSIANGVVFGMLSWVLIKVLSGRAREIRGALWVLAGLLAAYYVFLR